MLLLCFICLNECFSVSESMSVTDRQTDRQTEPLLEVLADLKKFQFVLWYFLVKVETQNKVRRVETFRLYFVK